MEEQLAPVEEPVEYDLEDIRKSGKLRAIVGNSSTSYFIYRGKPMGFEYELLEMFANDMGLELEVVIPDNMNDVIDQLNRGEGDIIAASLTITNERSEKVDFSSHLLTTRQVLVQRKPENWERMSMLQMNSKLIRNQIALIGETVSVRRNSSFYSRLHSLSDEIGGEILIETVPGQYDTEELIKQVADGIIDYTVADEQIAQLNATYYPNIDVKTPISFPQRIAWACRKNSPQLQKALNKWLEEKRRTSVFNYLKKKYFQSRTGFKQRSGSGYHSQYGGKMSVYDDVLKRQAKKIHWDWRLLASQVYQESRFDHNRVSWAGARGLMQMMPATASRFGIDSLASPEQNVRAGVAYIKWLDKFWAERVPDSTERVKFILASYNAGQGHVLDAYRLAGKYGNPQDQWAYVELFLKEKSSRKYYTDPVVKHGYCRGYEPVRYVNEIIARYQQYQRLVPYDEEGDEPDMALSMR